MEAALVTEAVYALRNPLGGPASMLEEAANRVRAGEDFHAVLGDYGLADGERTEKLEAFVAKVRASKRRVCGEHGPVD
jgi:hypothetical protein